jgi:hypothetical protein
VISFLEHPLDDVDHLDLGEDDVIMEADVY